MFPDFLARLCRCAFFSTAADEGEALSTTARPAKLCSPLGRTGDTLAEALVQEFVGNPRKVGSTPSLNSRGEVLYIICIKRVGEGDAKDAC